MVVVILRFFIEKKGIHEFIVWVGSVLKFGFEVSLSFNRKLNGLNERKLIRMSIRFLSKKVHLQIQQERESNVFESLPL